MRMNRAADTTAADILNDYTPETLSAVFPNMESCAMRDYRRVMAFRQERKIETTSHLCPILEPFTRRDREKDLAQAFQHFR